MRLIDIDAFRKENRMAEHCEDCERNSRECQYNDFSMMDFCGWLDDAPTVDAVLVTRCKDCKWYDTEYHCKLNGYGCGRSPYWFCADGKKEEE